MKNLKSHTAPQVEMIPHDTSKEDLELMFLVAQRDTVAFRKLVGKYLNKSIRFAERMVGDHAGAEDIAQELCLKIWNEAPRWQPKARFSTWLYQVLFNACIDYKRKQRFGSSAGIENILDESPEQLDIVIENQKAETVREAMAVLPERQRAALVLCYYEGMSNQKAAEVLGVNLGALQQLLFRARQNLKDLLEKKINDN